MMQLERSRSVTVAFIVVSLTSMLWLLRRFNEWRFTRGLGTKLPPGSMGWPVIGEMVDFLWCFKLTRQPDDFIAKRRARYGDIGLFKTHLFGYPAIVSCSPEISKEILASSHADGNFNSGWPSNKLFGDSAVGVVDGEKHRRLRRHLFDLFASPKALDLHLLTAQPIIMSVLEEWAKKKKIVAYNETRAMTFRTMCSTIVSFKSQELLQSMESMYGGLMAGLRAMTINIPGTAFHNALKCRKHLSRIFLNEIRERKKGGTPKHDFMQILMDSVDEDGSKLSETEVLDNTYTILLGGFESTANVMTWALYYLAKHPEKLEKLKDETRSVRLQKSKDELLTAEDIKNLKYASVVAEELIRLANVSPFIFRRPVKDDVFINGYKIPKEWKVIVWIRDMHLDSKYYVDPTDFNPDRWHEMKPKAGTFVPFSSGPRTCPGNNYARLQIMLFLHYVCLGYRWELLNPDAGVTYLPNPRPADGAEMIFSRLTT